MADAVQRQKDGTEHQHVQTHIQPGQARLCGPARVRRGQGLAAQPAHPQRQRQVQAEQPAPVELGQHRRGQHRPGDRAQRHHHGIQRHALAQQAARVDLPHQGAVDTQRPGHAHALQGAGHDQPGQGRCQRRQHAGQPEHQHAPQVHALVAQAIAQGRQRQQQHQGCDLVGIHHPQGVGRVDLPLARHLRQRQVQHGAVQHTEHQTAHDHRHGQLAGAPLHAIGRFRRGRCGHSRKTHIA